MSNYDAELKTKAQRSYPRVSIDNRHSEEEREPLTKDAPTLAAGVHAVLADELFVLRAWVADEKLDAAMRAHCAARIAAIEALDASVMADTTMWRHPLAWHKAIYQESLLVGYGVYAACERAMNLSQLDAATARAHYQRALQVIADHQSDS